MPIQLTDEDKKKTLAEYLNVTGTPEEIEEKLEASEKVRDVLAPILRAPNLYRDMKPFTYVIKQLAGLTLGAIESDRKQIESNLMKEYREIISDYEEEYGEKKQKPFLEATGYDRVTDGDDRRYFFRFWRSPITKILKYRGIDSSTPDGETKALYIVNKLYPPNSSRPKLEELLKETPEHLVEKQEELEQEARRLHREEENEREALKVMPFYETLKKFCGLTFDPSEDVSSMAQKALDNAAARERLRRLLKTAEQLDLAAFKATIGISPQQIEDRSQIIKKKLTLRNDSEYARAFPNKSFSSLLERTGRPELPFGEEAANQIKREALENIIGKKPVDNKAVREAMAKSCQDLKTNASKIVADTRKRKVRNRAIISALFIAGTLAMYNVTASVVHNIQDAIKRPPTPTVQKAVQPEKQKAPAVQQQAPIVSAEVPATQEVPATTNMAHRLAESTNAVPVAVADAPAQTPTPTHKPAAKTPMPQMGNRLVAMQWVGYKDLDCEVPEEHAHEWVIGGEFYYMFNQIRQTGLTYKDIFDLDYASQALRRLDNTVNCNVNQEMHKFYIPIRNTRTRDALMTDVLNFHMNMQDVLESLPVSEENMAKAQLLTMDAIGTSLGWSVKQQAAWQKVNPQAAERAEKSITELAQANIQKKNADTNDVEAVFMEVINATSTYRNKHPETQGLLLTADKVIRQIAGIDDRNMAKFEQVNRDETAIKLVHQADQREQKRMLDELSPQAESSQPQPEQKKKKRRYPWGWIAVTAIGTYWLTSLHAKRKARIIR